MAWSTLATWIQRRRGGLYLHRASAAPPLVVTLRPTIASMTYAAIYAADFIAFGPLEEIGGTFDPATAGANVALSDGNLTATFSGVGSVLGTNTTDHGTAPAAFELLYTGGATGWTAGGVREPGGGVPPYDPDAYLGGVGSQGAMYVDDGSTIGSFSNPPGTGPVLAPGDILGCVVVSDFQLPQFYLNGVQTLAPGLGFDEAGGRIIATRS